MTVDRLATDRLACFEGELDPGDAVCSLAEGGTLFAWTAASGLGEAASAATVLTGLEAREHGLSDDGRSFLFDRFTTIAEVLQQSGYATAAFVASPRVNRSRRLDQGFSRYEDRFASVREGPPNPRNDLAASVRNWIETAPSPWFVWIHASRDAGLVELDRLVSRLAEPLEAGAEGPGVLFAALRGEPDGSPPADPYGPFPSIGWRTHRVPLIWRAPAHGAGVPPAVSRRLASLLDIAPTLRQAALIPASPEQDAPPSAPPGQLAVTARGRDLTRLTRPAPAREPADETPAFVVVFGGQQEVGIAAEQHLYARRHSPLDGTGRPVPAGSLSARAARFSSLPPPDPLFEGTARTARLQPGPWRSDVLGTDSPVPRLEFHLARRLERQPERAAP